MSACLQPFLAALPGFTENGLDGIAVMEQCIDRMQTSVDPDPLEAIDATRVNGADEVECSQRLTEVIEIVAVIKERDVIIAKVRPECRFELPRGTRVLLQALQIPKEIDSRNG